MIQILKRKLLPQTEKQPTAFYRFIDIHLTTPPLKIITLHW